MKRKPIQIAFGTCVWIICNDGTIWNSWEAGTRKKKGLPYWQQVENVPQPEPVGEPK